jgi:hypothetical protein
MRNGLNLQGGTSTGRGVNDTCGLLIGRFGRPSAPILPLPPLNLQTIPAAGIVDGQRSCDATEPWQTSVRGLASYTVPKADVLVSGIFRSQANAQSDAINVATNGLSRSATYRMNAAQFLAATGRPLAAGLATQDVNLPLPGAVYGDRINAVDVRFAKVLRFGKTKANVGLDVYNLFNSNTPTRTSRCTTRRRTGRNGCNPRPCCCRGSCGSMCRLISSEPPAEAGLGPL